MYKLSIAQFAQLIMANPSQSASTPQLKMNIEYAQVDELSPLMSGFSMNTGEVSVPKRVTFSEQSTMQLYHLDQQYAHAKSYSREDYKLFGRSSMLEAVRIKKLLLLTPPGVSTKKSVMYLLENNVISPEEIRGIEHLVLCNSPSMGLQERRDHIRAVLLEQRRIRMLERHHIKHLKIQADPTEKLAAFSASRSSRSLKSAKIRAATAA